MIEFFVLLVVLMVLAVALGSWTGGPWTTRRVVLDRQPVVRRRRLIRERRYY